MMDRNEEEARQRTIQKLLQGMVWYTHEELAQLVTTRGTHGTELISHWLRERRIFCVPGQTVLYPQFQFDEKHFPHPVIKDVLACFAAKETWAIAAWFFFPNAWIARLQEGAEVAIPPMQILDNAEELLNAARKERDGTYFA